MQAAEAMGMGGGPGRSMEPSESITRAQPRRGTQIGGGGGRPGSRQCRGSGGQRPGPHRASNHPEPLQVPPSPQPPGGCAFPV